MDLADRLDRYIASKSRKPDPFASDTDAMRDQLTSGGMSEDQAFDLALAMARERERARDVPSENILGGDVSRVFEKDPTFVERLKQLPAQTLGAGQALASLGSAAALSVPSMVQSLVTGEKDPLGMMKRQMYVPTTEEGMGALSAVAELIPEIPAMPQVQLQALQAIPAGAAAAQAQRGVKQASKQLAPKAGEMLDEYMKRTGMRLDLTAYHGSPYQFEEFDPTKIGSGEGAQAYGYGHYFAESPGVAQSYADVLASPRNRVMDNRGVYIEPSPMGGGKYMLALKSEVGQPIGVAGDATQFIYQDKEFPNLASAIKFARQKGLLSQDQRQKLTAIGEDRKYIPVTKASDVPEPEYTQFIASDPGYFYTADIPDEMIGRMLDWDKPIGQQSETIQRLAKQVGLEMEDLGGDLVARFDAKRPEGAELLRQQGIPGVRYYDQASRPSDITSRKLVDLYNKYGDIDKAVDEMMRTVHNTPKEKQRIRKQFVEKLQSGLTRNFVVFPGEEKAIKMLERKRDGGLVQSFQAGGIVKGAVAGAKTGAKGAGKAVKGAKSEDEKTLPMVLERAPAKTKKELQEEAERIGRQIIGEHVTKPGDTANLAGYSKKVAERLKAMEEGRDYVLKQTTPVSPLASMDPAKGSILIGLPGDISIADKELKSLGNLKIGSQQQGGSLYGLPFKDDPEEVAKFWASNYGPANIFQNKVTEIGKMYPDQDILGAYMSMGRTGMNFAQHFADANLKAIRSAIRAGNVSQDDVDSFNRMIREGWSKKNKKTGEREYFKYPDFAGIENTGEAYAQMMRDPELRKWFNNRMKIGEETAPRGLPSGVDIEWAISEPELRNLEHSLVGYSVGKMQPGRDLISPIDHATYSHGIPGQAVGRLANHIPARLAFSDAAKVISETKRPQDFTGTIQKVFPHQVVDQQWQDEVGQYLQYLKRITGKKKGGLVKQTPSKLPSSVKNGKVGGLSVLRKKHGN